MRTEASAAIARAARAAGVRRLVQESIAFVYADGGDAWLDEDAPVAGGGVTTTALTAERNARELFDGDTVVLRFGLFMGPDSGSTRAALEAARGGASLALGPPGAYRPTLWLDDAAAAIAAALRVPAGTYNVADADPPTNAEIDAALAAAVGVEALRRAGAAGRAAGALAARVEPPAARRERLGAAHARGHGDLGQDRRMTAAERFAQARPRLLRLAYSELGDARRGRGRRAGGVAAAGAHGRGGDREPRRLADDGRRPARARSPAVRSRAPRDLRRSVAPGAARVGRPGGPRHARRVGQLRAADRARAALARGAHGVRAARRVRHAVRRGRRGGRPHARGGAPARLARPPPRQARAARASRPRATSTIAPCERSRRRSPRATSRASSRCSTRTSSGRRTAAGARPPRASRCAAARGSRARGRRSAAGSAHAPIEITLNGRLGLVLPSGDGHRAALSFVVSDGRITRIDAVRNPEKLRRL